MNPDDILPKENEVTLIYVQKKMNIQHKNLNNSSEDLSHMENLLHAVVLPSQVSLFSQSSVSYIRGFVAGVRGFLNVFV